jgi:hypothetical protein
VRAALAAKHSAIAERIIEVVGRRARGAAAAASAKFESVFRKLHAPVTGIEELTAVEVRACCYCYVYMRMLELRDVVYCMYCIPCGTVM